MLSRERPTLRLAHSPDPDDAFMWWPLFALDGKPPRIDTGSFEFAPVMDDIESLNQRAETGELEITAMSCAHYPNVADRYVLTACGASMGESYGPKLVAQRQLTLEELREPGMTIAVPGTRTSAFATLSLLLGRGRFRYEVVPFDQVIDIVASGTCAAGVVIHEGQLTFEKVGLTLVEDLGWWWKQQTGLLLPLGVNAVRRDLEDEHGQGALAEITTTLLRSVQYALAHREESVEYAMGYASGMDAALADEFIRLYVNRWTLDFAEPGRKAVKEFLRALSDAGLVRSGREIEFVQPQ